MEEVLGEVTPLQERARRIQRIFDAGVNAGLNSVRKTKADMDRQLSAQDCSKLASVIIWFSGELCLASTGAMTPNQDLYGTSYKGSSSLTTICSRSFVAWSRLAMVAHSFSAGQGPLLLARGLSHH
jgi:hypothetical protein